MPSTATTRNRLEKQGTGDNTNTWGTYLNGSIDLIDSALDGRTAFTLSGSKTLTSANYADDESRERFLDITGGTGGTVTIPAVEKWYIVRNNASGDVVFTTGSGVTVTVKPGSLGLIVSDGTNIRAGVDQFYVNNAILQATLSGQIPGQAGNAGKFLSTDGTNAAWSPQTWTLISTATASGAAAVDFTDLTSDYAYYVLVGVNVRSNSTVTELVLRTSTDNGATFASSGFDYRYAYTSFYGSTVTGGVAGSPSYISLTPESAAATGEAALQVVIQNAGTENNCIIRSEYVDTSSALRRVLSSGRRNSATAVNAIRLYNTNIGNTTSGTFYLYGVKA